MKQSRRIPKCVRPEEFKLLIESTPKADLKARIGFLLAYAAGLRVSEVLRCSKEHFRGDRLFIPKSKYGVERIVALPKGWKKEKDFKEEKLNENKKKEGEMAKKTRRSKPRKTTRRKSVKRRPTTSRRIRR